MVLLMFCAAPSASASDTATQRLVDAYAPIVMMRTQHDGVCHTSQEQYAPPTTVNVVLGNPRVRLLEHVGRHMVEVRRSPSTADLAGLNEDFYLNLPGNPLRPGCTYARDFAALRRAGQAPAITYAHIAREPGYAGFAVQYWFYYYFNQFNDLHESDWEGMQITFDESNATQALAAGPHEIVVFQHSGGEHTNWSDPRVQKQGRHPIVYSAAGSHATFYSSALWLGTGQNGSGVGCDNTTAPLTAFRPQPVLLPDTIPQAGRFAWLDYDGHWGQREAGFNDGPQGPNTKTVWQTPFSWMYGHPDAKPRGARRLADGAGGLPHLLRRSRQRVQLHQPQSPDLSRRHCARTGTGHPRHVAAGAHPLAAGPVGAFAKRPRRRADHSRGRAACSDGTLPRWS